MDLVLSVEEFPKPGETVLGKEHHWFPGGKGANQAVAIQRLNGEVRMVGKIGDDHLGRLVIDAFQNEGINTNYIQCVNGISTGLAMIQIDSQGQNTIVVSAGANRVWQNSDAEIRDLLQGYDLVVLQLEIPLLTVCAVINQARKMGLYVILNAAPADIEILPILSKVDLLIINETETALLSGEKIVTPMNIQKAISHIQKYGPKEIVVTLGADGCLVLSDDHLTSIPSYRVKPIDTTAAGDAFVGAMVARLCNNDNTIDAALWAVAAGALTATKLGAQSSIPTKLEVEQFLRNSPKIAAQSLGQIECQIQ